jgi:hypothetical protein
MIHRLKSVRTAVFAAGVGAALLFGATSVRAEARVPACTDPGAQGSCSTTAGCQKSCQFNYGASTGTCSSYCCYCMWF